MTDPEFASRDTIGFKRRRVKRLAVQSFLQGKPLGVGVDLAKKKHAVWLAGGDGVPITRFMALHSKIGIAQLLEQADHYRRTGSFDRLIVFMEPTAHFWINVANELEARRIEYRLVASLAVHRQREIEHLTYAKGDYRDAELILQLGMKGQWIQRLLEHDPLWLELHVLAREHETLHAEEIAEENRIVCFVELVLPEFFEYFKKLRKTASAVLRALAARSNGIPRNYAALCERLRAVDGHRINKSKLKALSELLEGGPSFGVERYLHPTLERIGLALERRDFLADQRRHVRAQLVALYDRTPYPSFLNTIPGVTPENHALVLGFTGDPKLYDRASCLVKLAGTEPRENASGDQEGSHSISHRGRPQLRHVLFRIALGLRLSNEQFAAYVTHLKTRDTDKLTWTQAAVAAGNKYLRLVHHLCTKREAYDPKKVTPQT